MPATSSGSRPDTGKQYWETARAVFLGVCVFGDLCFWVVFLGCVFGLCFWVALSLPEPPRTSQNLPRLRQNVRGTTHEQHTKKPDSRRVNREIYKLPVELKSEAQASGDQEPERGNECRRTELPGTDNNLRRVTTGCESRTTTPGEQTASREQPPEANRGQQLPTNTCRRTNL